MVGIEGLDHDRRGQPPGPHEQRHRLLRRSEPSERASPSRTRETPPRRPADPVERRFGADVQIRLGGGSSSLPGHATTGRFAAASSSSPIRVTPGRRLAKRAGPTLLTHGRPSSAHRRQASRSVVGQADRGIAVFAAHQRLAGATGEDACAPGDVADAQHR